MRVYFLGKYVSKKVHSGQSGCLSNPGARNGEAKSSPKTKTTTRAITMATRLGGSNSGPFLALDSGPKSVSHSRTQNGHEIRDQL